MEKELVEKTEARKVVADALYSSISQSDTIEVPEQEMNITSDSHEFEVAYGGNTFKILIFNAEEVFNTDGDDTAEEGDRDGENNQTSDSR